MGIEPKRNGFTLIEILVVILILGILIGLIFGSSSYVVDSQARKKARIDVELLKSSVEEYKVRYGSYPHCPSEICTPGECLFLSLAGFHNEKGNLQIPPYQSTLNPNLLDYDLGAYNPSEIPPATHEGKQGLLAWFAELLGKDVAFKDSWGNEYVYECPREDGASGFRIYSLGPDGKEGEGFDEDNIE